VIFFRGIGIFFDFFAYAAVNSAGMTAKTAQQVSFLQKKG